MAIDLAWLVLYVLISPGLLLESPRWSKPQDKDDSVVVDYPINTSLPFYNYSLFGVSSAGRNYTAYVGVLPSDISERFSFELPTGGCGILNKTSGTAHLHDCVYATNAGYFDIHTDKGCVGNLITNGKVQQLVGNNRVNFGLTESNYTIGYITNTTLGATWKKYQQLISGAGWLVRDGEIYINTSAQLEGLLLRFVMEKAPRTGICAAFNGSLLLVQVDGEEDRSLGVDLYEFSSVMQKLRCQHAVNLDGGGSSTSVYRGTVINKPTCNDTSVVCQRQVSSITCIK